jgi:hypothetical protein
MVDRRQSASLHSPSVIRVHPCHPCQRLEPGSLRMTERVLNLQRPSPSERLSWMNRAEHSPMRQFSYRGRPVLMEQLARVPDIKAASPLPNTAVGLLRPITLAGCWVEPSLQPPRRLSYGEPVCCAVLFRSIGCDG